MILLVLPAAQTASLSGRPSPSCRHLVCIIIISNVLLLLLLILLLYHLYFVYHIFIYIFLTYKKGT